MIETLMIVSDRIVSDRIVSYPPKSYNRTNPVILQKQKCLSLARLFSKMSPSEELTALLLPLESIEKKQNSPKKYQLVQ